MRISDWSSDVCSSDLMFQLLFRHDAADSQCIGIGDWLVRQAGDARSVLKLQVVGAEFPVPWALLYLVDRWDDAALDWERFLGMRHVVEQIPLQNDMRSEEHTSELQSLMRISYAVFCLKK